MTQAPRNKFVWPPRPLPAEARNDDDTDRSEATFIEVKSGAARKPTDRAIGAWEQIERTWLGLTTPPLAARALDEGFVPDEPGGYCSRCGRGGRHGHGCAECANEAAPWDRLIRLGPYEGLLGSVIRELKFERWRRMGMDLGRLMGAALGVELRREGIAAESVRVTKVPSHWMRRLVRGIDHTAILAKGVAAGAGVEYTELLGRSFRMPQGGLGGEARRRNVRGTMRGRGEARGVELVVVVDDVKTTGATLEEASRAVRRWVRAQKVKGTRGKKVLVWCLVAAVAG